MAHRACDAVDEFFAVFGGRPCISLAISIISTTIISLITVNFVLRLANIRVCLQDPMQRLVSFFFRRSWHATLVRGSSSTLIQREGIRVRYLDFRQLYRCRLLNAVHVGIVHMIDFI